MLEKVPQVEVKFPSSGFSDGRITETGVPQLPCPDPRYLPGAHLPAVNSHLCPPLEDAHWPMGAPRLEVPESSTQGH